MLQSYKHHKVSWAAGVCVSLLLLASLPELRGEQSVWSAVGAVCVVSNKQVNTCSLALLISLSVGLSEPLAADR